MRNVEFGKQLFLTFPNSHSFSRPLGRFGIPGIFFIRFLKICVEKEKEGLSSRRLSVEKKKASQLPRSGREKMFMKTSRLGEEFKEVHRFLRGAGTRFVVDTSVIKSTTGASIMTFYLTKLYIIQIRFQVQAPK